MKSILFVMTLMFSLASFASVSSITNVLEQKEVEELETKQSEKGFRLSNIEDVFATSKSAPRCPCQNLKLTFSRFKGDKIESKQFIISANGMGSRLKVTVTPVR